MNLMPKSRNVRNITIAIVLLAFSYGLVKSTLDVYRGGKRLVGLENELMELEKRKAELDQRIEYKQTDAYIEERARNDLNLIKPGESVFVVSGPGSEGYLDKRVLSEKDIRKEGLYGGNSSANWFKWFKLFF